MMGILWYTPGKGYPIATLLAAGQECDCSAIMFTGVGLVCRSGRQDKGLHTGQQGMPDR